MTDQEKLKAILVDALGRIGDYRKRGISLQDGVVEHMLHCGVNVGASLPWIPVSSGLAPDHGVEVIVSDGQIVTSGFYEGNGDWDSPIMDYDSEVTHWMAMPPLPEIEDPEGIH